MQLHYEKYDFTPVLGWSISRYEVFDKCRRQYFYTYYPKSVPDVPHYKIKMLRELTSVPLEVGNVVHDVIEAFLKRLQLSDSDIDEKRFFDYGRRKTEEYFSQKTFMEIYYRQRESIDMGQVHEKVSACLRNFMGSPCYAWIFMTALRGKENWMIEPAGFGETRIAGLKAYCKMDFLMPVNDDIYILDWKTGSRDEAKHGAQLKGYAAATASNFGIPWARIFPKIVYLYPFYGEYELQLDTNGYDSFANAIKEQTQEMYACCANIEENIPLPIDNFSRSPSPGMCRQCRYQELCFPQGLQESARLPDAVGDV